MRLLYIVFIGYFLVACSTTPQLDGINGIKQGEAKHIGEISSVGYERKSSLIEDFGSFVTGNVVGEQFGGGDGKEILGIVGGVAASEIYEQNFADVHTKLNIVSNGNSYPVYIKGHLNLKIGDKVKISVTDNKITGIDLL